MRDTGPTVVITDGYERGPRQAIRRHITQDDHVLEVGAGIGGVTTELVLYGGPVIALEPQPTPFRELRYNVSGAAILPLAASIDDEQVRMTIYEDWHNSHVSEEGRACVVPSVNVNRLMPHVGTTALVMDCEGYEAQLLSGIEGWQLDLLRLVALEQHPKKCDMNHLEAGYERLKRHGFELVDETEAHPEELLLYKVWTRSL